MLDFAPNALNALIAADLSGTLDAELETKCSAALDCSGFGVAGFGRFSRRGAFPAAFSPEQVSGYCAAG